MPIKAKASNPLILAASLVFVFIPLFMNISIPSSALACGGCAENYPFLHNFPTDGEITEAKVKFVEEYTASMLQVYRDITIVDTWQIKLKRPGIEKQDSVVDVILCFKEEHSEGGVKSASYHYTMIAYDESGGFFFWPYSMGSFASREKLDDFLREHVIERSDNLQVVESGNLGSLLSEQKVWGFLLIAMLILVGLTLAFLKIRAKAGQ